MTNIEKLHLVEEGNPEIKQTIQDNWAEIEDLLVDRSTHLGVGRTAEVCFCGTNKKLCVKIYKRPDQIMNVDFYLSPDDEMYFMDSLRKLDAKVKVPKALATFKGDGVEKDFLIMEALPAVSIDDILQDRVPVPANLNLAGIRDDLMAFIKAIHEAHIYHRDLHEGNIMINPETGQVYVIDFGAATQFYGEIEPGERGPYHVTKDGRDLILTSDESELKAVIKKLAAKLTKSN